MKGGVQTMYNRLIHLTNLSDPSILMHLIRYGEKITGGKHLKQWFRLGLDIEDSVWGVFLCFLFYMAISGAFFTLRCFLSLMNLMWMNFKLINLIWMNFKLIMLMNFKLINLKLVVFLVLFSGLYSFLCFFVLVKSNRKKKKNV